MQPGLATCYNRQRFPEDDERVLEGYGWSDIEVPPYETPETEEGKRRLESFQDEIIDRLFALKARRAEEERRLGLAAAGRVGKGGN
jgi:hypothetical protein